MIDKISHNEQTTATAFEERMADHSTERYVLCLYIAGLTPRSTIAVERVQAICERYLAGRYELTIIDLYLQPEMARQAQIVVAPTLVKKTPSPMRLFVGDMTDEKRILQGLNVAS
ncbi:MAG: circadian clock KaiB family protein [Planctomycetaceae bacterium]